AAAPRPEPAAPAGADLPQPDRPDRRGRGQAVARRGGGPEGQPGRRPAELAQMDQITARRATAVSLGIPALSYAPGRTVPPTAATPGPAGGARGTPTPHAPRTAKADALRAAAAGLYPDTAGVELILSHATWLHRSDFTGRFKRPQNQPGHVGLASFRVDVL